MIPHRVASLFLLLLLLLLSSALPSAAADPRDPTGAHPLRIQARAFDSRVEIEVRNLPRDEADEAIRTAVEELVTLERLLDPHGDVPGGLGRLNAAAGQGAQSVDPRLRKALERAWDFCLWSQGAHGPLGGRLYELWGLRGEASGLPQGPVLEAATASASCDHLRLSIEGSRVILEAGSVLDLWGFAEGYAVDRVMEVLQDRGATNAWVSIGRIRRGLGGGPGGPEGAGWYVPLPVLQGFTQPMDEIHLKDSGMAILRFDDERLRIGGDSYAPYLDQRTGQPTEGVEAVIVVTDLAVDAQALAGTLMILKNREGQLRLGGLQPHPAVIWLLGDGTGTPLIANYHWSQLKTR